MKHKKQKHLEQSVLYWQTQCQKARKLKDPSFTERETAIDAYLDFMDELLILDEGYEFLEKHNLN